MSRSGKTAMRHTFGVTNGWDWNAPVWFLHAESNAPGGSVVFDAVIVDDCVMPRMPVKRGSVKTHWVIAPSSCVVCREGKYAEFVATVGESNSHWKGVSVRIHVFAEPREIGFIEYDPADRAKLLKNLGSIFPPVN